MAQSWASGRDYVSPKAGYNLTRKSTKTSQKHKKSKNEAVNLGNDELSPPEISDSDEEQNNHMEYKGSLLSSNSSYNLLNPNQTNSNKPPKVPGRVPRKSLHNDNNDNISDLPSKIPKKNFSNSIHSQNINNQRPNQTKFSVPGVPASNSAGNLNNVLVNKNNNNQNNQNFNM